MFKARKRTNKKFRWTPEIMTQRLMSQGYDVTVMRKGDLWQFVATRDTIRWKENEACYVVYIRDGKIVLPLKGEI